jgi:nucleoside phosphorylase/tetratricopeptide (TPR) repeat protein
MSSDTELGTVVICAALDVEYRAVRDHLNGPLTEREERGALYQVGTFRTGRGRWQVALRQTNDGNARAAVELERAVAVFHPQIVLFVGVAGGRKDVRLGDVVIADEIYDYESGKDTAEGFRPRIKTRAPAHRLIERARLLARDDTWQHRILPTAPETTPKAVIKPVAAGSKVIADQNAVTAQYLAIHCGDAVAVEMEGYGFLHGAYVNESVQALVVRGISDLLSGKTEAADERWQPVASAHAAAFAFELLACYTPPPAATAVPRQLLAAPHGFTGRTTELNILTNTLDKAVGKGGTVAISALGGAGGIGKTWLALYWAHTHLDRFPDGQLFVDLHGYSPGSEPMEPLAAVRRFLDALGVPPERISGDLDTDATLYRSLVAGKRMLIVLDNAVTSDQVLHLLPGSPTCTVLVTGRKPLKTLITRHGARHLHLDVLSESEAHALLVQRLGPARVAGEPDAARELIRLCGCHPLALAIRARHAQTRPGIPLEEIVAELRESRLEALDDEEEPASSLPFVLSLSLRDLTEQQRTVFALLGIAPGADTTLPAVASLTHLPSAGAREALSALEDASVLERRSGGRYVMHDLVREYAATTAHSILPEHVQEAALVRVLDFYLHTAHAADRLLDPHRPLLHLGPPAVGVCPHPLPNAEAAMVWLHAEHATLLDAQRVALALGRYSVVCHLAWALNTFHFWKGHLREALTSWRTALNAAAQLSDLSALSRAHRNLGHACSRFGLHEEAIGHLDEALALVAPQQDPRERALTHEALAVTWGQRGDDRRALDHARHALALYRTLDEPVWEAAALNLVGWFAARTGELDVARDHCRAALTLYRHHHDPDGEAAALDSLGLIAYHAGDHRQALDHYRQALTLYGAHGNTYGVADTLDRMGNSHSACKQPEQARVVWLAALKLYREQGRDSDAERVQQHLDGLDNSNHNDGSHK